MAAVQYVNSKADIIRKAQSAAVNINAAKGLQEVLKTNLGPKGTIKMLVGGAGQIKLTKDGSVLLHEMQIQHPTAAMIARAATAQDDIVGDGTTSSVLFIGELLKEAERCLGDGVHPRVIAEGFDIARGFALQFLDKFLVKKDVTDKEVLNSVARTSLRTKVHPNLANQLTTLLTDAILLIKKDERPVDLFMIEIMHMVHKADSDTRLVRGLVLDHGCRHAGMPSKLENCFILTCNVSLEYEKTEINSVFTYSNATDKDKLVEAERKFTDDKVRKIIDLKRKVCEGTDKTFVIINQKGIDPISLDMLAKENIMALRRAKRRNMERLVEACGGVAVNSVEDLTEADLGWAGEVHEHTLGEDKFTFVEGVKIPLSCTILIKGPTEHSIAQTKEAIRDGLRAVRNTIEDGGVLPGAGAFEVALSEALLEHAKSVSGKVRLGVQAFANALLIIPKTLASNSGFDTQDVLLKVIEEHQKTGNAVGVDVETGEANSPEVEGILDNYCVKKQFLNLAPVLAQQLLLVDEIIRAGVKMGNKEEA